MSQYNNLMKDNFMINKINFTFDDLLFNLKYKKIKKTLYIYKHIKKNNNYHAVYYFLLKHKIFNDFHLIKLDILIRNNKIEEFWYDIFIIIIKTLFNKKQNDKYDIKFII